MSRGEGAALMNRSGRAESSRVAALQFSHGAFRFVDSVVFFPVRSCSGDAWAPKDDFVEVDATCGEDFQGLLHIWLHVHRGTYSNLTNTYESKVHLSVRHFGKVT